MLLVIKTEFPCNSTCTNAITASCMGSWELAKSGSPCYTDLAKGAAPPTKLDFWYCGGTLHTTRFSLRNFTAFRLDGMTYFSFRSLGLRTPMTFCCSLFGSALTLVCQYRDSRLASQPHSLGAQPPGSGVTLYSGDMSGVT